MLRRIVLAATISAASLGPLAGAGPAGATELPLPLGLFGGLAEPAPEPGPDRLTVVVADTGDRRTEGRYELRCDPPGGTHPASSSACRRLDEFARSGQDPFRRAERDEVCTQQYGGSATARVTGTWQGRPVDAAFTRANGCEIARWNSLVPVLPSARS
jgi:hypothetical protein